MSLLDIQDLSVAYQSNHKDIFAVNHVSLSINAGESMGVVGESGSGKSTLAMAILCLLPKKTAKVTGSIHFMGKDLTTLSEEELKKIRWKLLSVVFQKSMNGFSPVHRIGTHFEDIYRVNKKNEPKEIVKERVLKLFDTVNLSSRVYDLYPHELSGGMLQRTSIALSLLFDPPLIVLDEATTALDVITQGQILNEIKRLERERNVTTMTVTHDISVVASSCKKVAVMYAGQLMEFGDVNTVLKTPSHPYTQGLLKSFPTLKGEKKNLKGIPGSLPDLSLHLPGCPFAPRCNYAKERCHKENPNSVNLSQDHRVSCHFYNNPI